MKEDVSLVLGAVNFLPPILPSQQWLFLGWEEMFALLISCLQISPIASLPLALGQVFIHGGPSGGTGWLGKLNLSKIRVRFFLATAKVSCHQPCQRSQQKESYLFIQDLHESQSKHSVNLPLASHTLPQSLCPSLWRECFPPSATST